MRNKLLLTIAPIHLDLITQAATYEGTTSVNVWVVQQAVSAARKVLAPTRSAHEKEAKAADRATKAAEKEARAAERAKRKWHADCIGFTKQMNLAAYNMARTGAAAHDDAVWWQERILSMDFQRPGFAEWYAKNVPAYGANAHPLIIGK
jgi:hypothetical protein